MSLMSQEDSTSLGPKAVFGPNDGGYIWSFALESAKALKEAQKIYSLGHYPHSNARVIPIDHPLRKAMVILSEIDKEFAHFANRKPGGEEFKTFEPTEEQKKRWD